MKEALWSQISVVEGQGLQLNEFRLAWWAMCLQEVLAWHMGVVLDAYSVKRTEEGWTLRIQGRRRMPGRETTGVVTWASAHSPFAAFELFAALVRRNEVQWKEDKYPVFDEPL